MKVAYCPKCERETGFQRKFGFGTLFAVICTIGWWILALPFYPKRCNICGGDQTSAPPSSLPPSHFYQNSETKVCPHCAETIKLAALKCRYCGEVFSEEKVENAIEASWRIKEADYNDPRFCPFCRNKTVIRSMRSDGHLGPWCPVCKKDV